MQHGFRASIALLIVVLLSSCAGSTSSPSHSRSASTGTATSRTAVPVASTPAGDPTATATRTTTTGKAASTSPAPRPCVAADLSLAFLGQQGGMGQGLLGFALRNSSVVSCLTGGYPGIQFFGSAGQPLPTTPTRTTRDFIGSTPVGGIVLGPGRRASFRLTVSHGGASPAGCTTAAGLQVIAPNDTATLRTTIPDGAYECGAATVSPMQPGSSAYP